MSAFEVLPESQWGVDFYDEGVSISILGERVGDTLTDLPLSFGLSEVIRNEGDADIFAIARREIDAAVFVGVAHRHHQPPIETPFFWHYHAGQFHFQGEGRALQHHEVTALLKDLGHFIHEQTQAKGDE